MGCDIHMKVEVLRNGQWTRVDELPPRACSWREEGKHYGCYNCNGTGSETKPYHDRNYTVFSVLANVRNSGNVTTICDPRGLPVDATHGAGDGAEYEYGDHSFSWLTLREILAYDWQHSIRDEGWVDAEAFAKWVADGESGPPKGQWCASVTGLDVRHVSHSEMRRRTAMPYSWEAGDRAYTLIQWRVKTSDYAKQFLAFVDSLATLGDPDDVRLVFGFDS